MAKSRVLTKEGDVIGNWTVISFDKSYKNAHFYFCKCACGKIKSVRMICLRIGNIISCGCKRGDHRHTSGGKPSPTYSSWKSMMARCTQPSNPAFEYYTKKGITICQQWYDFNIFIADVGERPSLKHSLDRIDGTKGYEPNNVRWATKIEQANNRITNILFEYQGQKFTLSNLARYTNVSKETLRSRLCRSKRIPAWTVEEAVNTPSQFATH